MFPKELLSQLSNSKVVAGFSIEKVEDAIPIAKALLAGGIEVIELTLRTNSALDAVKCIAESVPEIVLGVGTILTPEQAIQIKQAGADFGVSPGMNPDVIKTAQKMDFPFAPGIATPSELEAAIALGCRFVKFFPAEANGGVKYLKSMSTPYKHLGIKYFPLGGLNVENMNSYLDYDDVIAIGGSWIVDSTLVEAKDWIGLTNRAAEVRTAVTKNR
ncbi:MAG: keto-deoxy-phosphogluconate aldolase [Kiritimatiellaceae bacterium]|jgi:2-dehydro-3-deoxyphosphogluconate aldolase/(4S)-4-hydroxy-2-oxoglutarate aldolase|nr:keto-deoxy-phosphogluconate aldolase [Kiritimatiellaceae bacterium]